MQVLNRTSKSIIVFGWSKSGRGKKAIIGSGMSWYVKGPCIGRKKNNDRKEHMDIPGKITIQETPGRTWRRHRLAEDTLSLIPSRKNPEVGIGVRFCLPEEE